MGSLRDGAQGFPGAVGPSSDVVGDGSTLRDDEEPARVRFAPVRSAHGVAETRGCQVGGRGRRPPPAPHQSSRAALPARASPATTTLAGGALAPFAHATTRRPPSPRFAADASTRSGRGPLRTNAIALRSVTPAASSGTRVHRASTVTGSVAPVRSAPSSDAYDAAMRSTTSASRRVGPKTRGRVGSYREAALGAEAASPMREPKSQLTSERGAIATATSSRARASSQCAKADSEPPR